jgi:quinohemoprotein ethanol dehydrogenase
MRLFRSAVLRVLSGAIVTLALAHPIDIPAADVDAARLLAAPGNNADWLTHGRTYDEQRFSPLARIDQNNISELKLAWFHDFDTTRGQEATPLVIDGTLYVTSAWSKVFALDARSGR